MKLSSIVSFFIICHCRESAARNRPLAVLSGGTWGNKPYPVAEGSTRTLSDDLGSSGKWYTDFSDNGWRIRQQLLNAHNYVRKVESANSEFMLKLVWDFNLEAYSRQWGSYLCNNNDPKFFEHSPDDKTGIPAWPYRLSTGENLYATTADRGSDENYDDVILKWFKERDYYDWNTGAAKSGSGGKPVGHWKQLVRPQAGAVGCSVVSGCHKAKESGWKAFVVCHYDYGNIGTHPYIPKKDSVCKSCPSDYGCCENGLCTGYLPVGKTTIGDFGTARQMTNDAGGCKNFVRHDCEQAGGVELQELPGNKDTSFEYNRCYCGDAANLTNTQNLVADHVFWFRNQCFQASPSGDGSRQDIASIYASIYEGDEAFVDTADVVRPENSSSEPFKFTDEYIEKLASEEIGVLKPPTLDEDRPIEIEKPFLDDSNEGEVAMAVETNSSLNRDKDSSAGQNKFSKESSAKTPPMPAISSHRLPIRQHST